MIINTLSQLEVVINHSLQIYMIITWGMF